MLGQLTALLIQTQRRLEALYALEPGPAITDFIQLDPSNGEERLLVRQVDTETLEIRLVLPSNIDPEAPPQSDDHVEVVEGVSHFVHLAERARTRLPTSQLELEFQAEVDKFALLWDGLDPQHPRAPVDLHEWLFERVRYLHDASTMRGQRYRLANDLAARLCARLLARKQREVPHRRQPRFPVDFLRRFYRCGLAEKIHLAQAA